MGNLNGKFAHDKDEQNNKKKASFNPKDPAPEVSAYEEKILKEMWDILKNDIDNVGVITFVR